MTIGFETRNLAFVPPGGMLRIVDVAGWRRIELDSTGATVVLRDPGLALVEAELDRAVERAERRKAEGAKALEEARAARDRVLFDLRACEGPDEGVRPAPGGPGAEGMLWWVRLSDTPGESFHEEDYDEARAFDGEADAFPVYGSLGLAALGGLEVALPGAGADAPMWLVAPRAGERVAPLDPLEPLPLVHEFCGAQGVSSRGASVNIDCRGAIAAEHMGAVPLRRLGDSIFATLYFHLSVELPAELAWSPGPKALQALAAVLGRSRFEVADKGPRHTIVRRSGDVVHLYTGLEGRESDGVPTMPPLLVVAMAGGSTDPMARADLLEQIRGVCEG